MQYYSSRLVRHRENAEAELGFLQDAEIDVFADPSWISLDWVCVVPWGIRKLLKYVKVSAPLGVSMHTAPKYMETGRQAGACKNPRKGGFWAMADTFVGLGRGD